VCLLTKKHPKFAVFSTRARRGFGIADMTETMIGPARLILRV
jgi:hypothetical protein